MLNRYALLGCYLRYFNIESNVRMKSFSIVKRIVATIFCVALSTASFAELVWTVDKGWQVKGGVLAGVVGENVNVQNALDAMNEGKKAMDNGDYRLAIGYYKIVVYDYPNSIFAPEAYFQMSNAYVARGQFMDGYDALAEITKKYPDYPRFNQVIGAQYEIASKIQSGATPYLWGWFPWFTNYNDALKIYEDVVKNAPYSDYAPIALMNEALLAENMDKTDTAFDALDRLINNYPNSMFAPDAYLEMAKVYRSLVNGAPYDQTPTKNAISFFKDYLILFPNESQVANAEEGLEAMEDTYARSRLIIGDFYYYYRNNPKAASIFYNETITIAPKSKAADEARSQLKKIKDGVLPPMTPYDWFWGRYENPPTLTPEQIQQKEELAAKNFNAADFIKEENKLDAIDNAPEEKFAPLYGEGLGEYLYEDGFFQWTSSDIENAED